LLAHPFRDALGNAVPDGDEAGWNNGPRLAKLDCLPGGLPLLTFAPESQVRQFMLDGGRDKETGKRKPLSNK